MRIRHWFRPPHDLLVPFLGTTLVLSAALGWLGWRLLQQDRAVELQRVHDQLQSSADLIAAELRQTLSDAEEQLTRLSLLPASGLEEAASAYAEGLGEDALVVVFQPGTVLAYPGHRLAYYPVLPTAEEPAVETFAAGEDHEFRTRDFDRAIAYFEQLSESDDDRIRAGALLRLARNQRKASQPDAALATYSELASMGLVSVGGQPAELVARRAQCDLLEQLGRQAELRAKAQQLDRDLHRGRWQLDRAAYMYFATEALRWLEAGSVSLEDLAERQPAALSLAAGVKSLWEVWQQNQPAEKILVGRQSLRPHDRSVFLLWRGSADRLAALVAGPGFLEGQVLGPLQGLLERQGVRVALADVEGRTVVSQITDSQAQNVVRTMADTGLPWTLRVVDAEPMADLARLAGRRRLLFAGLGFMALLVVAGIYFSVRAMSREIEAARLQSDFVAAVSHEFRTPLTSLRQFTDLLADGRASSSEDRDKCYAALQRGTRRLTRLVENLLDFGRMEAGSREFNLESLRAKDWVERVTSEFQEEVQERGYRVELGWNGAEAVVRADEAALGRALWNLLDNAVKYSPACKTIWVTGEFDQTCLTISVRDRGIGVPRQEQSEIFRKFVRGSALAGHAVKGTGLGLAMVEQIVRAHNGEVRLESKVGEGSKFSILLPAQE